MDPHTRKELAVFSDFALASGLRVVEGSVEKRPPPEPDVLCEIEAEGPVAFELLELVDQERVARPRGIQDEVEDGFGEGFSEMAEPERVRLKERLGNATVRVLMSRNVSSSRRRTAISMVLRALLDADERFEGDYPLPGKLRVIARVTIVRGNFSGPRFKCISGSSYDPIPGEGLARKFQKVYKSHAPIELLAYFSDQHAPPQEEVHRFTQSIESSIKGSRFRRVWIYDANGHRVCGLVENSTG
jgi:hypothetical protein